jgi:hypothetical protein
MSKNVLLLKNSVKNYFAGSNSEQSVKTWLFEVLVFPLLRHLFLIFLSEFVQQQNCL